VIWDIICAECKNSSETSTKIEERNGLHVRKSEKKAPKRPLPTAKHSQVLTTYTQKIKGED